MTLPEIGEKLREARKAQHLSQGELAGLLGMSRATISGIENGTVGEIGVRKLMALAAVLDFELLIDTRSARPTLHQLRDERRATHTGG
jgi:HTH-type transcriptional regulator/antitoxin HipB